VLATTEINKVPDTIISRCQVFNFKHLSIDEIVWRLEHIAWKEWMEYDVEALRLIFLWVVSANVLQELMDAILSKNYEGVVSQLDTLVDWGTDLYALAKDILLYLDDHFMEKPAEYAPLTWMMQEITAEMKWYPHPALVWKRKLYEYTVWVATAVAVTPQNTTTVQKEPMVASPKVVPTQEQKPVDLVKENKAIDSLLPEPATETIPPKEAPTWTQESTHTSSETPATKSSSPSQNESSSLSWSQDFSTILEKMIEKTNKIMIRSALKQQTMIQSFDEWVLVIIIISEQFYHLIQKQETEAGVVVWKNFEIIWWNAWQDFYSLLFDCFL